MRVQPSSVEPPRPADALLAASLAKLWPHREHESSCFKNLLCHFGLHRWSQLNLDNLLPGKEIRHCFWCSKVRVDGVTYGD
jgi:hypothetical protein